MRFAKSLALGLLLVLGTAARAEPIWSYSWSSSPTTVASDDGSLGKVTFTPGSGSPQTGPVSSGPGIIAATLDATGPASGTAVFTNRGYGMTMHLIDLASHQSADLNFTGALSGTLGSTFNLTNKFTSPTTQSVALGDHLYNVTVGLYTPPQPGNPGSLGANVGISGSGKVAPVSSVPEPTSLLLAAFGGSVVGLRRWWHRQRGVQG
jgi:PEP-CTERM motif